MNLYCLFMYSNLIKILFTLMVNSPKRISLFKTDFTFRNEDNMSVDVLFV